MNTLKVRIDDRERGIAAKAKHVQEQDIYIATYVLILICVGLKLVDGDRF